MKKIFAIMVISFVLCMTLVVAYAGGALNAYEQKVLDALSAGVKVDKELHAFPVEYINQARNYFLSVDVDGVTANRIVADVDGAYSVYNASIAGFDDWGDDWSNRELAFTQLDEDTRGAIFEYVKDAAEALGLTAEYDVTDNRAIVTDDAGNVVFDDTATIKVTGSGVNIVALVLVVSVIFLSAVAAVVVIKKVKASV